MRGYNLSSRPKGVKAYDTGQLTADIRGLIHERGAESALLVGHEAKQVTQLLTDFFAPALPAKNR